MIDSFSQKCSLSSFLNLNLIPFWPINTQQMGPYPWELGRTQAEETGPQNHRGHHYLEKMLIRMQACSALNDIFIPCPLRLRTYWGIGAEGMRELEGREKDCQKSSRQGTAMQQEFPAAMDAWTECAEECACQQSSKRMSQEAEGTSPSLADGLLLMDSGRGAIMPSVVSLLVTMPGPSRRIQSNGHTNSLGYTY